MDEKGPTQTGPSSAELERITDIFSEEAERAYLGLALAIKSRLSERSEDDQWRAVLLALIFMMGAHCRGISAEQVDIVVHQLRVFIETGLGDFVFDFPAGSA